MKISNLWLFFFQGTASGTSFVYDGRANGHLHVRAATVGPARADDSRGYFRRHSLAEPVGTRAYARSTRAWAVADAVASALGTRTRVATGRVTVEAQSTVAGVVVRTTTSQRVLRPGDSAGNALAFAPSTVTRVRTGHPSVEAEAAGVVLQFVRTRSRHGAFASAEIGIDVVEAELEEILLLMEVA